MALTIFSAISIFTSSGRCSTHHLLLRLTRVFTHPYEPNLTWEYARRIAYVCNIYTGETVNPTGLINAENKSFLIIPLRLYDDFEPA